MLQYSKKPSLCVFSCPQPRALRSPTARHLPIMPLTVPKSTEPWVGVELSPRFCSTSEPWQKTLTNSPRWKTPTSCRCCRSSSVVAALIARWRRRRRKDRRIKIADAVRKTGAAWEGRESRQRAKRSREPTRRAKTNKRGCQKVEKQEAFFQVELIDEVKEKQGTQQTSRRVRKGQAGMER